MSAAYFAGGLFALAVSIPLPVLAILYMVRKRGARVSSALFGAACFTVFQLLTRLPLISLVLERQAWFVTLNALYPVWGMLFAGCTASLFEETGRLVVMSLFMRKSLSLADGVAFGLGHGGVEAALFTGLNAFAILIFHTNTISPVMLFAGGFERISAMTVHVCLSVMVARSLASGKKRYFAAALVIHALVDFGAVLLAAVSIAAAELCLAAFAAALAVYTLHAGRSGPPRDLATASRR